MAFIDEDLIQWGELSPSLQDYFKDLTFEEIDKYLADGGPLYDVIRQLAFLNLPPKIGYGDKNTIEIEVKGEDNPVAPTPTPDQGEEKDAYIPSYRPPYTISDKDGHINTWYIKYNPNTLQPMGLYRSYQTKLDAGVRYSRKEIRPKYLTSSDKVVGLISAQYEVMFLVVQNSSGEERVHMVKTNGSSDPQTWTEYIDITDMTTLSKTVDWRMVTIYWNTKYSSLGSWFVTRAYEKRIDLERYDSNKNNIGIQTVFDLRNVKPPRPKLTMTSITRFGFAGDKTRTRGNRVLIITEKSKRELQEWEANPGKNQTFVNTSLDLSERNHSICMIVDDKRDLMYIAATPIINMSGDPSGRPDHSAFPIRVYNLTNTAITEITDQSIFQPIHDHNLGYGLLTNNVIEQISACYDANADRYMIAQHRQGESICTFAVIGADKCNSALTNKGWLYFAWNVAYKNLLNISGKSSMGLETVEVESMMLKNYPNERAMHIKSLDGDKVVTLLFKEVEFDEKRWCTVKPETSVTMEKLGVEMDIEEPIQDKVPNTMKNQWSANANGIKPFEVVRDGNKVPRALTFDNIEYRSTTIDDTTFEVPWIKNKETKSLDMTSTYNTYGYGYSDAIGHLNNGPNSALFMAAGNGSYISRTDGNYVNNAIINMYLSLYLSGMNYGGMQCYGKSGSKRYRPAWVPMEIGKNQENAYRYIRLLNWAYYIKSIFVYNNDIIYVIQGNSVNGQFRIAKMTLGWYEYAYRDGSGGGEGGAGGSGGAEGTEGGYRSAESYFSISQGKLFADTNFANWDYDTNYIGYNSIYGYFAVVKTPFGEFKEKGVAVYSSKDTLTNGREFSVDEFFMQGKYYTEFYQTPESFLIPSTKNVEPAPQPEPTPDTPGKVSFTIKATPVFVGGYYTDLPDTTSELIDNATNYIYLERDYLNWKKVNVVVQRTPDTLLPIKNGKPYSDPTQFSKVLIASVLLRNKKVISKTMYPVGDSYMYLNYK